MNEAEVLDVARDAAELSWRELRGCSRRCTFCVMRGATTGDPSWPE